MNTKNLTQIWNKVPVDYYQKGVKRNLLQALWHGQKSATAKKIIKELKFNNCLDVGCASGYMISTIRKQFPKASYFGIDAYDKVINYAQKTYPGIEFKVAPAEKLPFKDNSFDLVICYETIEHVENPAASLKEVRRVLSPQGTLILAMDSGSFIAKMGWVIWENTKGRVWKDSHITPFHHKQLQELVRQSGYKINKKLFTHLGLEVVFILSK